MAIDHHVAQHRQRAIAAAGPPAHQALHHARLEVGIVEDRARDGALSRIEGLDVGELRRTVADRLERFAPDPRRGAARGKVQHDRMNAVFHSVGERFYRLGLHVLTRVFASDALQCGDRRGIFVTITERLDRFPLRTVARMGVGDPQ